MPPGIDFDDQMIAENGLHGRSICDLPINGLRCRSYRPSTRRIQPFSPNLNLRRDNLWTESSICVFFARILTALHLELAEAESCGDDHLRP
jgi:hypothetical protein